MKGKEKFREMLYGYCFTLPALLFMIGLIGYPIIYNVVISFQDMTVQSFNMGNISFAGIDNYKQILSDPVFGISFKNTVLFTVACIVIQFSIGFALAILFSRDFRLAKPLRGFLIISWMIPTTVTALMFKYILSADGILNDLLLHLRLTRGPVGWLISEKTAIWGTIIANVWVGIPFNMLLLSTGLCNISQDIYESASIDGAKAFQRFFYITLPMMKQSILSVLVLGVVYTFKVFDLIYVMTGGGPVNATEVLSLYSYRNSFKYYNFGIGAAGANILFVCLFLVGLIYLRMIGKEELNDTDKDKKKKF